MSPKFSNVVTTKVRININHGLMFTSKPYFLNTTIVVYACESHRKKIIRFNKVTKLPSLHTEVRLKTIQRKANDILTKKRKTP
jgi:hypothetical protein